MSIHRKVLESICDKLLQQLHAHMYLCVHKCRLYISIQSVVGWVTLVNMLTGKWIGNESTLSLFYVSLAALLQNYHFGFANLSIYFS